VTIISKDKLVSMTMKTVTVLFVCVAVIASEDGLLEQEDFQKWSGWNGRRVEREIVEGSGDNGVEESSGSGDGVTIEFPNTERVVQEVTEKTEEYDEELMADNLESGEDDEMACEESMFGCCPDSKLPQHGPNEDGCCLTSQEGCCNDFLRSKEVAEDSCGCEDSRFGCCPDGVTAMWDEEDGGCGCKHTTWGCCQDQYTAAEGPDYQGCPCGTSDFGCCSDGETEAKGPNGEGCEGCEKTEFGCCSDQFTPASGADSAGCDCAASEFGCCPDGISEASGLDFEGCAEKPGEACQEPKDAGKGDQFSVQWFFDIKEGRCSRFWYGGSGGNKNRFKDHDSCEEVCINPPGSARCYLPKIEGVCTGNDQRWFYDSRYKQCNSFRYGGCLGNNNRFVKKSACEETCIQTDSLSICEQPLDGGPCRGQFERWYYDEETGVCSNFTYGGCQGNKNRFVTQEACENSCSHKKQLLEATKICKKHIATGSCNETLARWGFDAEARYCRPFYYSGCDGNENNFKTRQECKTTCPNAFPPELNVVHKIMNAEEGNEILLEIKVSGNPYPDIFWQHNTGDVEYNERVMKSSDNSVLITKVSMEDAGTWMVTANNGLGKLVRKQISLSVYPSSIPIKVTIPDKDSNYEFGSDITLSCETEGYPEPTVRWYKNNAGLPVSDRIIVDSNNVLTIKRASPIDGGVYICRAWNKNSSHQAESYITVEEGSVPLECKDQPQLANCKLVVKAKACTRSESLARICCASCMLSGQIAGPPAL